MKKEKSYKHLIWDWNGTLLDDVGQCVKVVNVLLAKRDLPPLTVEKYREQIDFPIINFYRRLGFDFTAESYESVAHEYMKLYIRQVPQCRLQKGTGKILTRLTRRGITHSLLSAYHQQRLEEAVDHFHLRQWFIKLIGLNDYYAHSKIENGRQWIRELQYDSQDVLFIGDMCHDYEVAQAMGIDCVALTCGHQSRDRLSSLGITIFDSLEEVAGFLKS